MINPISLRSLLWKKNKHQNKSTGERRENINMQNKPEKNKDRKKLPQFYAN
jgi:hypothetical protein